MPGTASGPLTQLAAEVGVSRQTIIAIERGDCSPSVYLALRAARALSTTVEALFSLGDAPATAG